LKDDHCRKQRRDIPEQHRTKANHFRGAPQQPPARAGISFIDLLLVKKYQDLHQMRKAEDDHKSLDINFHGNKRLTDALNPKPGALKLPKKSFGPSTRLISCPPILTVF
jgi:hypothetical protein